MSLTWTFPGKQSDRLKVKHKRIYNPITAMGFSAVLPFSWITLRDKHCRHLIIAVMGVVDTFGQSLAHFYQILVVFEYASQCSAV